MSQMQKILMSQIVPKENMRLFVKKNGRKPENN